MHSFPLHHRYKNLRNGNELSNSARMVLDSVVERVKLWAEVTHYHPIYSINEDRWFIPRGRSLI